MFSPLLSGASLTERLIGCLGAIACLTLTVILCAQVPFTPADLPIVVASVGSSAVLVFAIPASPLAQPWPVVGGNTVSALVGILVYKLVPDPALAAGLAVGLAILAMSLLRCLHPPGGASALTAVIGSEAIHAAGWGFAIMPVAINATALVALAVVFHRCSGRSYPHRPAPPPAGMPPGLHASDIDAALAEMHESFDISREDLDTLLSHAERHAQVRARKGPR